MTEATLKMDGVIPSMQIPIQKYAQTVHTLAGTKALSLTLYGAIVGGSFDPSWQTARSVVVFDSIDLEILRNLGKEGARLGKAKIAAPLIMTPEYIQNSLDSFPLEFLEIQQRHRCLFGQDSFAELSFYQPHLRLQCERELKSMLIGMRQGLLAAGGQDKWLSTMEVDIGERLIRALRGLLWLHGQMEGKPAAQTVSDIEESLNKPLPGIRAALHRQGQHGWDEFTSLYEDIEALRTLVDTW